MDSLGKIIQDIINAVEHLIIERLTNPKAELPEDILWSLDRLRLQSLVCDPLMGTPVDLNCLTPESGTRLIKKLREYRDSLSSETADERFLMRKDGYWEFLYKGRRLAIPDVVGISTLATILSTPNKSMSALEVLGRGQLIREEDAIDSQALTSARRALEEAETKEEKEAIASAIARDIGLGKKSRKTGSQAEKASCTARKQMKRLCAKINLTDPELSNEIENLVRVGLVCVYSPSPTLPLWNVIAHPAKLSQ